MCYLYDGLWIPRSIDATVCLRDRPTKGSQISPPGTENVHRESPLLTSAPLILTTFIPLATVGRSLDGWLA